MSRSQRTGSQLSNASHGSLRSPTRINESDMDESSSLLPSYSDVERKKQREEGSQCLAARHVLAFMAFLGFVNVYCLRVDLSVALVAMVNTTSNSTNSTSGHECPDPNGGNSTSSKKTGEFDWDEKTQGYILGAFFYGYIITQLPGGWLASRYGGKNLFGYGVLGTSILTIITPFAARYSVYMLIAVRVLEGIGEGVTFPAMHSMWGSWAPVWERSKLVAFTYAGAQLGTVISLPISGILCDSDIAGGWPSAFYFFGVLGCLWFVAWMLLVHNTPAEHPRISITEREYIESSIGKKEILSTPWKQIATCPAVWAIIVAHFTSNWGFYTLLTSLPTYMSNILKFNVKQVKKFSSFYVNCSCNIPGLSIAIMSNGLLSALPYACSWLMQNASGFTADYLRHRGYVSTGNARKIFNSIGVCAPGFLLLVVGYVGCDHLLAMVFLTLSVGLGGGIMGGYNVNHLDIAPKFAGVLMGVTNCFATIPGFLGPAVVGYLTDNNQTRGQWRIIFYITSCMYFFGAIFYNIFAKGEEMPWSRMPHKELVGNRSSPLLPPPPPAPDRADATVNNTPPPEYSE
ncbi:unnamed protein product [Lymnaea stagnalis]|uniref:Sialin n=1 Tax=Lymnaea stagnalis TaxID=6523 RepID=A0AAV2IAH7_LYMST